MKILAFDISSISTGVALIKDGYLIKKYCSTIQPNPKKSMGERLTYFVYELAEKIDQHKPDLIVIEDIFRGRNIKTFKVLAQFRGVAIQKYTK